MKIGEITSTFTNLYKENCYLWIKLKEKDCFTVCNQIFERVDTTYRLPVRNVFSTVSYTELICIEIANNKDKQLKEGWKQFTNTGNFSSILIAL